jgi:hypothetical protein
MLDQLVASKAWWSMIGGPIQSIATTTLTHIINNGERLSSGEVIAQARFGYKSS